jgi:branched-chain amino acid transport system permease protein
MTISIFTGKTCETPALSRPARWIAGCVILALLAGLPLVSSSYALALISEILIFAIFAMSLDLLIGYTGLLSFGHAAFFGLSAYAVIILNVQLGLDAWIGLVAGVFLSAIAAVLIGAVSIRVSGISFLMLTMAFSQLLFSVAVKWRAVTGGTDGISGLHEPMLFGHSLEERPVIFYVVTAFFLVSFWGLRRLVAAPLGSVFIGIRENEARMRALGYDVQRFKLLSFVIAGAIAGVSGALYALFNGFVSSDALHWSVSGDVIVMIILGGTGTIIGPVVGAAIFLLMKNVISSYTDHWMMIIGIIFIACVLFMRQGFWGVAQQLYLRSRARS